MSSSSISSSSISSSSGNVDDTIVMENEFHPNPTWASVALAVRSTTTTTATTTDASSSSTTTSATSESDSVSEPSGDTKSQVIAESKYDETPLKFTDLDADEDVNRLQSMPSVCMACFKEGMTRMLLTRIPFYRDVIVMSFSCDECGYSNSELQPASDFGAKACRYELKVSPADQKLCRIDLNRQVVKSENASIYITELQFEIPATAKRGDINTVEGIIDNARTSLQSGQAERRAINAELADKLQVVIDRLQAMSEAREPFTFILDDIGGNSFLENPYAPNPDHRVTRTLYTRNTEQNAQLGITAEASAAESTASATYADKLRGFVVAPELESRIAGMLDISLKGAVLPGTCSECHAPCQTKMCLTDIPYFKEIIIMCTDCDNCGYKDSEVKPGGAISSRGRRVTLRVASRDDLKRDVMKSDTAGCSIPDIDLELTPGTLGGKYTSIEGLLNDIREQIQKVNQFALGDSGIDERKEKMADFLSKFELMRSGQLPFTFILDDPAGNAHIGSVDPITPVDIKDDKQITVEEYERSFEQNEELGLNDIDVDEASYRRGYDDNGNGDDHKDTPPASTSTTTTTTTTTSVAETVASSSSLSATTTTTSTSTVGSGAAATTTASL